jgi:hypothetical protein
LPSFAGSDFTAPCHIWARVIAGMQTFVVSRTITGRNKRE